MIGDPRGVLGGGLAPGNLAVQHAQGIGPHPASAVLAQPVFTRLEEFEQRRLVGRPIGGIAEAIDLQCQVGKAQA